MANRVLRIFIKSLVKRAGKKTKAFSCVRALLGACFTQAVQRWTAIYQPYSLLTDNNPLTYIMTSQNLDATGHRWVNALAQCKFTLRYQKGKNNVVADALSRLDRDVAHEEVGCVLRAKGQDLPFPAEAARPCVQEVAKLASLQAKAAQVAPVDWTLVQAQDPAVQAIRAWIAGRRRMTFCPPRWARARQ